MGDYICSTLASFQISLVANIHSQLLLMFFSVVLMSSPATSSLKPVFSYLPIPYPFFYYFASDGQGKDSENSYHLSLPIQNAATV